MIQYFKNQDGTFCVSQDQTWVDGCYESKDAANLACQADPSKLAQAWKLALIAEKDVLTLPDVQALFR